MIYSVKCLEKVKEYANRSIIIVHFYNYSVKETASPSMPIDTLAENVFLVISCPFLNNLIDR